MGRRFGKIQQLPSGNHRASFIGPDGPGCTDLLPSPRRRTPTPGWPPSAPTWSAAPGGPTTPARSPCVTTRPGGWPGAPTSNPAPPPCTYRCWITHILPTLGDRRLRELTQAVVRDWHTTLGTTTRPTARAQAYRLLRTICNQAVRDGKLRPTPARSQCRHRRHPRRPVPTLAQVHALADLSPPVPGHGPGRRLRRPRFGELTALTQTDLTSSKTRPAHRDRAQGHDRINGKWIIGTPKSDAGMRTVALPGFLTHILDDHLDTASGSRTTDLVFATPSGRPLAGSNWTATFGRARKQVHRQRALPRPAPRRSHPRRPNRSHAERHHGPPWTRSPRAALIYQHAARDRDHAIAGALEAAAAEAQKAQSAASPPERRPTGPPNSRNPRNAGSVGPRLRRRARCLLDAGREAPSTGSGRG